MYSKTQLTQSTNIIEALFIRSEVDVEHGLNCRSKLYL